MIRRKLSIPTKLYGSATGGGVKLRHPLWADYEDWVTLRRDNRSHLVPWEPEWNERHLTRSAYRTKLARFKAIILADEGYPFHVFRDGDNRLIGACNITRIERGPAQTAKLGYWIGQAYTRQGFAQASVKTATQFCFDILGLHRVEAAVKPDNLPSIKVLEAVGYQREGLARGFLKINGKWEDHITFAKLSSD